ncbi:protein of unknown function DUF3310 [Vibrio phage 1.032.O._10N.261.54.F5]|nr:protein of unknown function DUF3310 [Vibrio phage 1.032.O._10N.261.54.F5]
MYYDSIEEAINASPGYTHVLTTGPAYNGIKEREGKYVPVVKGSKGFRNALYRKGRCYSVSDTAWVVASTRPLLSEVELLHNSMVSDIATVRDLLEEASKTVEFYNSIAAARHAFSFDVLVLKPSPRGVWSPEAEGKYVPVIPHKTLTGEYCHANASVIKKYKTGPKQWMHAEPDKYFEVVNRLVTPPEPDRICGPIFVTPQPTTDQLVTAARSDQAASEAVATDRQIGGDHYKSLKIQPIEYIDANNMPYLEGNVVKHVTRHASKNGVQDIDKAIHYLELIKQMRYAEDNTSDK